MGIARLHISTALVQPRSYRIRRWRTDWGFVQSDDPFEGRDVFLFHREVADEAERQQLALVLG